MKQTLLNNIKNIYGWKTIKDYLQEEGFEVKSPRAAISSKVFK